ncbi:MAG: hypothetical protein JNM89_15200 [Hyphomicrobiaceae bacterium]|nr:hypothetical protein [Hyphomicrobiaceae bacterium]
MATGAVYYAYAVSIGFAGENCRFPRDEIELWPLIVDWAALHGMFAVLFALPIAGINALLAPVRVGGKKIGAIVVWLALSALVLTALGALFYLLGCQGRSTSMLLSVANILRACGLIAIAAFFAGTMIGYIGGLGSRNPS